MAQDIRKMLKGVTPENAKNLSKGHEARFAARLEEALPVKKQIPWLRIAAIVIAFLGVSLFAYYSMYRGAEAIGNDSFAETEVIPEETAPQITLGDLSPDLKKVEDFYTNGINVQLASLEVNDDNKDLIDGYLKRMKELDEEYQRLSTELNDRGPSEATVNAMINNLQLRLELLFKLKNKLKELKEIENEQFNSLTT